MFLKSVSLVAAGTGVAQAITILTTPILTRLYGPDVFGILGLFTAILAIITPLSAFSYPIAIVLPAKDGEAIRIAKLSFWLATISSAIALFCIVISGDWIVSIFNIEELSSYIYLIPLAMFFTALYSILNQWVVRKKLFALKAKAAVLHSVIFNATKATAGVISPIATVLVTIASLNTILHASIIWRNLKNKEYKSCTDEYFEDSYKNIFVKYKDFLIYRTPQVFLNAISQSIPVIMLTSFFGVTAAGFYSLAKLALAAPSALVGEAVSSVFYPKFNEAFRDNENSSALFIKATLFLALLGLVPFGIIVVYGADFFTFIFGSEWSTSGDYGQWLAVWLYFGFVNRPSVAAIPVLKMQGFFLVYEIFSVVLRILSIVVGFYLFDSGIVAIALFSIAGTILNITLIACVLYKLMNSRCV